MVLKNKIVENFAVVSSIRMRLMIRMNMTRYLAVLIVSMTVFTSAQAKPNSYQEKVVNNCKMHYKVNKKNGAELSPCVLDYSNRRIGNSELRKIFSLMKKNKELQWVLRLSGSRINVHSAQAISNFLRKGVNIDILDILFNDIDDEGIKKIIAAANANRHIRIVSLQDSTVSKLDDTYLTNDWSKYPRLQSGELKVYLGRRFLRN